MNRLSYFLPLLAGIFYLVNIPSVAQVPQALLLGRVVSDSSGLPIAGVRVSLGSGDSLGTSDASGRLSISIPFPGPYALMFSHPAYDPQQTSVTPIAGEMLRLEVRMPSRSVQLREVTVTDKRVRTAAGEMAVDVQTLQQVTVPFGEITQQLASGAVMGVVSNNELSTRYATRGGSFDENMVYINDIPLYQPFLIKSGEQEGLSAINGDLVGQLSFSAGGWQAAYGDKLSSLLRIQYKRPERFEAALSSSLLGGSAYVANKHKRVRYLLGTRYKSSQYLLGTLDTKGEYLPRFADVQAYTEVDLSRQQDERTVLDVLLNYAENRYKVVPTLRETTFGTLDQAFKFRVAFEGSEQLNYRTLQGGVRLRHRISERLSISMVQSGMRSIEQELSNLESGYLLGELPTAGASDSKPVGLGTSYQHARNLLQVQAAASQLQLSWRHPNGGLIEAGLRGEIEDFSDRLDEYSFYDSAGYVRMGRSLQADNRIVHKRLHAFAQARLPIGKQHLLSAGMRLSHLALNGQWLLSPRLQYLFTPKENLSFQLATGVYHQPPLYRELRDRDGKLHTDLKAQSAWHIMGGADYDFQIKGHPFRFSAEAYYKQLWNVIAYDLDNIRVRYHANNDTKAFARGLDLRLSGELLPGMESWVGVNLLDTQEDLKGDERGYLRRPTDQRFTFTLFLQDHLPSNPTLRVQLRLLYGSGYPYGPPNRPEYRAAFSSNADYKRVDIGFSKHIALSGKYFFREIVLGAEVLNLLGIQNNISFTWIPDTQGRMYGIPNSLSQRFLNVKVSVR